MAAVLVVDGPHDAATDLVIEALSGFGGEVFRFDMAQFPAELELRGLRHGPGGWSGTLATEHRTVDLSKVRAVYWNRPNTFAFPGMSESDAHWARGASVIGLGGVLAGLAGGRFWMNHPHRSAAAEFKPEQLRAAAAAGFDTLRTVVTNSPDAVREFAKTITGPIITKPMGVPHITHQGGMVETMRTRPVDLEALEGIETSAHLFQEQVVDKAYEVRLFAVGATCYSVRIDAGSDAARLDWRTDYDALEYRPIPTPGRVARSVSAYMELMGLTYAAFDFAVRPDERWIFFEANPSGQWAWLNSPECPIAAGIADTLKGWCAA